MLRLSLFCLLVLFQFLLPCWAAEAPTSDAAIQAQAPWWAQLVTVIVTVIVVPFVVQYLKAKTAESQKAADLNVIDANRSLIDQRGAITERLKTYLFGSAAAIAEKEFPRLCAQILAGRLQTADQIKMQLRLWGDDLKGQAVEYFRTQGIDLLTTFGPAALDDLIARAANMASPFPGKDTAVALLQNGIADQLLLRGVEWMKRATINAEPPHPSELTGPTKQADA